MWVKGWITAPAAISASRITQFAPMRTPSPRLTRPSKTQLTSISTSLPHSSWPRTSSRAGSARRTPASISASAPARWKRRSRSASCTGLLTPSTSVSLSGWRGHHRHALGHGHGDDVGQVVLALRVVVLQRGDPALQRRGGRGHHAGVDLADARAAPALASLCSTMPRTLAGSVAQDAAVAGGVGQFDGQQRQLLAAAGAGQRGGGVGADQRHVAVEDQRGRRAVVQRRHGLLDGMAGAELRHLAHEDQALGLRRWLPPPRPPWPVMTTVRPACSGTQVFRTCCNRLVPPRRCSTFGRADFMRVPLPAAMITMFRAMRSSTTKAAIIGLWLLALAAAGRLQRGTNWLQPGTDAGLVVARRLHGFRCRAGAEGEGRAEPVVRLAPHDPAARLCRPAGRGPGAGAAAGHAAAGVPLGRRPARAPGRGLCAWRADGGRAAAGAEAGAAGASGAPLSQVEPGLRRGLPAAGQRRAAARPRSSARSTGRRCCTAASTNASAS